MRDRGVICKRRLRKSEDSTFASTPFLFKEVPAVYVLLGGRDCPIETGSILGREIETQPQ